MRKEIFRAGKWTDGNGNTREWTESDLDAIAKTFSEKTGRNTNGHEVPLTPGHPKDDTPALGVVKRLWREGKALFAEFKDIKDDVVNLIKDKTFRDVSIALKEGVLRHVGLTNIPAVPGLTAFQFDDGGEYDTWEFTDEEGLFKRFKNWLVSQPVADQVKLSQQEIDMDKVQELENKFSALEAKFSAQEDEVNTLKADKEKLESEKAETEKKFADNQKELDALKAEKVEAETKAQDIEDGSFVDGLVKDGKLVPALKETTLMAMKALRGSDEFKTYKEKLEAAPKVVEFGQMFDKGDAGDDGDKLHALTTRQLAEMKKTDPTATYSQAADRVMDLHPELLQEA